MEIQRPPDYTSHSPAELDLPAVPVHGFGKARSRGDVKLPDLKTVLSPEYQQASPLPSSFVTPGSPASARSLGRIDSHPQTNGTRQSVDSLTLNGTETGGGLNADEHGAGTMNRLSVEDPDIRDAAEALAGLGNPEFIRSPHNGPTHVPSHVSPRPSAHMQSTEQEQEPEPLLHLLTQAHPWVGGTINGSLSAYTTTKSYTPRFVQASVNVVERNITTPMVSTVGSVGRMTGVESVARWYLEARQPNQADDNDEEVGRSKRRRMLEDDEMDIESGIPSPRTGRRRESQESRTDSLPAYRASKPPSYREEASPVTVERSREYDRPSHNRSWSSGILHTASGLGVAMSESSRRSLIYCLQFLSQSAEHISTITYALKLVLEQYDEARDQFHQRNEKAIEGGERPRTPENDEAARRLAEILKKHCDDIWQTLKAVVHRVSTLAGGALPANAREFVRTQLLSLPQRWQYVSSRQSGNGETSRSAHRMVAFATEGLDMIGQVSQMCKATLDSAEGWLSMVGRKRPREAEDEQSRNGYAGHEQMMVDVRDERHADYAEKQ